jgi:AcrR family transcriptional regulator
MGTQRSTATQRRAQATAAGMRAFADHGLTTSAIQQVADEIGVSQPYVFRLFGSKQAFLLACLDELEDRIRESFRETAAACQSDPLEAMGAGFRNLLADGVAGGLLLQAFVAARSDEQVAARSRALLAGILEESQQLTHAAPEDLAHYLARGALVVVLQAMGVDLTGGSRVAVDSLRAQEVVW